MNQNKFTFESEELVVDWISFKFQSLDEFAMEKIARYLYQIGINSYKEYRKLAKPVKEPIFVTHKNQNQVLFVYEAPYWKGTLLHFSGSNARLFYSLIKNDFIDWQIFSSGVLSRFDLNYSRFSRTIHKDQISTMQFLQNCQSYIAQNKSKKVQLEKNSKG